ncbi:MAG: glycoside hydrolase family 172 protein [Promethearchaeota archaeon]
MKTHTELDDLPIYKDYCVKQVSTHAHDKPIQAMGMWKEFAGTMHRDNVGIAPNGSYIFPEMEGPGKIINIWFTMTPAVPLPKGIDPQDFLMPEGKINKNYIRKHWKSFLNLVKHTIRHDSKPIIHKYLYLRIYFDDEEFPSVDCPIGDFFGTGFGEYKHYWSRYINTTAGGYTSNFHMPFKRKARVEIVNTSNTHGVIAFYGAITYAQYNSVDDIGNQAYFHCKYHEEHPTKEGEPFLFLDTMSKEFLGIEGRGHLVGLILSGRPVFPKKNGLNYLEGNTKFFIDGEREPSIEYTGTEDIFQGAWYYMKGIHRRETEFHTPYHGLNKISQNKRGSIIKTLYGRYTKCKTSQYRFFPEGIPFKKSLKVILHHGEFDEVITFYDGVVYWYQEH